MGFSTGLRQHLEHNLDLAGLSSEPLSEVALRMAEESRALGLYDQARDLGRCSLDLGLAELRGLLVEGFLIEPLPEGIDSTRIARSITSFYARRGCVRQTLGEEGTNVGDNPFCFITPEDETILVNLAMGKETNRLVVNCYLYS